MVKKLVSVFCICAYFGLAHAQIPQEIWKESEQIEKQIKKTSFPDRVYNIKDFGAKEGNNGEIFCHEAINLAILTCSQAGGGTVLVPPGEFLTGPITLKSNVNLHLEEGAYLKFFFREISIYSNRTHPLGRSRLLQFASINLCLW